MGAVTNLRPDLWAAIVAAVPFVDMINTMCDPTLPLTVLEYDQWGDPNDPQAYAYIRSYSPYDNLEAKRLSAYSGDRRPQRSARLILGAGKMDRQAAHIQ